MAFCSNCGAHLTGTEAVCPACGTPQASGGFGGGAQQAPQASAAFGGGAPQQTWSMDPNPNQNPYPQYVPTPQPEKKSKKGLVIGLSIGGVLLVAGVVVLILFLTGVFGSSPVGNYKLTSIAMNGETKDDAALSAEERSMFLALEEEGKGYIVERNSGAEDGASVTWTDTTVSFSGLSMQMTRDGNTITLQENGGGNRKMVFAGTKDPIPANPGGGSGKWNPVVTIPKNVFVGSWKIISMEASGMKIDKEMLSSLGLDDMRVDITEDYKVTLSMMGTSETIQGSVDGEVLMLADGEVTYTMILKGGNLVWDMGDEGVITFERK